MPSEIARLIEQLSAVSCPTAYHLAKDRIVFSHDIGGVQNLFLWNMTQNLLQQLTAGNNACTSPSLSPDGRKVAFVSKNSIQIMDIESGAIHQLTEHAAGNSLPQWSPDGQKIAFYSRRKGWDQIWVSEMNGNDPYLFTEAPYDHTDLEWSPDCRKIAYASIREHLCSQNIYMRSFSDGREIPLTEGRNVFHGAPRWSPGGDRISFFSEKDDWFHLYIFNLENGRTEQLTFGEFEDGCPTFDGNLFFSPSAWSPNGRKIAFIRCKDGMKNLMVVSTKGGGLASISQQKGVYSIVGWDSNGEAIIATHERSVHPKELVRVPLSGSETTLLSFTPRCLKAWDLVAPVRVDYPNRDDIKINGLLYRPSSGKPSQRYPAIIYPHEGPNEQALASWHPYIQLLVQAGYVVMSPDFRGSTGYGRGFREANTNSWGQNDLNDVLDGVSFLQGLEFVESKRLGMAGSSYGGYLTLCALCNSPQVFKAGVDLYGDSELAESFRHGDRKGRIDIQRQMGTPEENKNAYRCGSPLYQAQYLQAPLLILHGTDDMKVVPLMSKKMIEALQIESKLFYSHFYDGEGHGFSKPENLSDAMIRITNFMEHYL